MLDQYEHDLLAGALAFSDHRVAQVIIALPDLVTVTPDSTPAELEQRCAATMQRQGAHLTRVIDPTDRHLTGVAALEDVLEELVGEVRDATQRATATGTARRS